MVGLGDAVLHLEELLGVDVRPGVLLTVDNARLQGAGDFLEGQLLGRSAHRLDHRNRNVGGLDAELQAVGVGRHEQRLAGGELLEAGRPVAKAGVALGLHHLQQFLALVAGREGFHGIEAGEQERQVEQPVFQRVGLELRQRRRSELDVAQKQRFQNLVVVIKRRVREDLHAGRSVHFVIDALGEHVAASPFG